MTLHWPQLTYLLVVALGLGISLKEHGNPKTGKHSVWVQITGSALGLFLLYQGGFFK